MCMIIWQVYITNEGEWYANKVLQGLFSSPIEMLVEVAVADIVCLAHGGPS